MHLRARPGAQALPGAGSLIAAGNAGRFRSPVTEPRAILLVQCPDRPGIVAAISSFLFRHGANITDFDQHTSDEGAGAYFTRLECRRRFVGAAPAGQ